MQTMIRRQTQWSANLLMLLAVSSLSICPNIHAQESNPEGYNLTKPNLKTKTLGGMQFWSDVLWVQNWRVQHNVVSGHYRLLDPDNERRAWGTLGECREVFAKLRAEQSLRPLKKTAVVLLHGLARSQSSLSRMAKSLEENPDWEVANVAYASGRLSLDQHASNLHELLHGMHEEGVEEVHFVAHSLGNLVARRYLGQLKSEAEQKAVPACKRIVMLAPPNQGSRMAVFFRANPIFRLVAGTSGQQIADLDELEKLFPIPDCEFGIIAGGRGTKSGHNPLLQGDDDLIVSVNETKLDGAHDFLVVPAVHTFIMNDLSVQRATRRFLEHGYFVSEETRAPLASQ